MREFLANAAGFLPIGACFNTTSEAHAKPTSTRCHICRFQFSIHISPKISGLAGRWILLDLSIAHRESSPEGLPIVPASPAWMHTAEQCFPRSCQRVNMIDPPFAKVSLSKGLHFHWAHCWLSSSMQHCASTCHLGFAVFSQRKSHSKSPVVGHRTWPQNFPPSGKTGASHWCSKFAWGLANSTNISIGPKKTCQAHLCQDFHGFEHG